MNRRSDIGWFELIVGINSVSYWCCNHASAGRGTYLDRDSVWCACNLKRNWGYCSVCQNGTLYRVWTDSFTCHRNPECDGRIYARGASGSRKLGACNDSSNLDYCALYFQTFSSAVYEDALRNDLLYDFTDSEYPWSARWNPSDLPADDHDPFHGCACRRLHDH